MKYGLVLIRIAISRALIPLIQFIFELCLISVFEFLFQSSWFKVILVWNWYRPFYSGQHFGHVDTTLLRRYSLDSMFTPTAPKIITCPPTGVTLEHLFSLFGFVANKYQSNASVSWNRSAPKIEIISENYWCPKQNGVGSESRTF